MGLKVWSEDCLEDHRAGSHDLVPCVDCYPCHLAGIRFNTHALKFWNRSKDSAGEIASETKNLAKQEGRDLMSGNRWT